MHTSAVFIIFVWCAYLWRYDGKSIQVSHALYEQKHRATSTLAFPKAVPLLQLPLFCEEFLQDFEACLWEFLSVYPEKLLWGQTLDVVCGAQACHFHCSSSQRWLMGLKSGLYTFFHTKIIQPCFYGPCCGILLQYHARIHWALYNKTFFGKCLQRQTAWLGARFFTPMSMELGSEKICGLILLSTYLKRKNPGSTNEHF